MRDGLPDDDAEREDVDGGRDAADLGVKGLRRPAVKEGAGQEGSEGVAAWGRAGGQ